MSTTYEITVLIKANGRVLQGFPLTRRLTCIESRDDTRTHTDEVTKTNITTDYKRAWNDQATNIGIPKFFYISADNVIRVQSGAGDGLGAETFPIVLDANGFILAVGLSAAADATATNAAIAICNAGADTVERIIAGGDE